MKKILALATAAALSFSLSGAIALPASAATKYSSCASLNKKFPTGVARSSSAASKLGSDFGKPKVDKGTYDKNKSLDKDKDQVICPIKAGSVTDAYSKKWGSFETLSYSGVGDDVIELPSNLKAGFAELAHDGESNFIVTNYDKDMEMVGLLANEIGYFTGASAFGVGYFENPTRFLEVTADGTWTITLKALSLAPTFTGSGQGTGVFKANVKAGSKSLSHDGESNFIIWQYCTNGDTDLLANEIGYYSGRKLVRGGTCLIVVDADGSWSMK